MTQQEEHVGIGEFRRRATEIIRNVEGTATRVVVSRHGKPVVELTAYRERTTELLGSVTIAQGADVTQPAADLSEWNLGR